MSTQIINDARRDGFGDICEVDEVWSVPMLNDYSASPVLSRPQSQQQKYNKNNNIQNTKWSNNNATIVDLPPLKGTASSNFSSRYSLDTTTIATIGDDDSFSTCGSLEQKCQVRQHEQQQHEEGETIIIEEEASSSSSSSATTDYHQRNPSRRESLVAKRTQMFERMQQNAKQNVKHHREDIQKELENVSAKVKSMFHNYSNNHNHAAAPPPLFQTVSNFYKQTKQKAVDKVKAHKATTTTTTDTNTASKTSTAAKTTSRTHHHQQQQSQPPQQNLQSNEQPQPIKLSVSQPSAPAQTTTQKATPTPTQSPQNQTQNTDPNKQPEQVPPASPTKNSVFLRASQLYQQALKKRSSPTKTPLVVQKRSPKPPPTSPTTPTPDVRSKNDKSTAQSRPSLGNVVPLVQTTREQAEAALSSEDKSKPRGRPAPEKREPPRRIRSILRNSKSKSSGRSLSFSENISTVHEFPKLDIKKYFSLLFYDDEEIAQFQHEKFCEEIGVDPNELHDE